VNIHTYLVVSAKFLGSLSHSKPQFNITNYDDPQKDCHAKKNSTFYFHENLCCHVGILDF